MTRDHFFASRNSHKPLPEQGSKTNGFNADYSFVFSDDINDWIHGKSHSNRVNYATLKRKNGKSVTLADLAEVLLNK